MEVTSDVLYPQTFDRLENIEEKHVYIFIIILRTQLLYSFTLHKLVHNLHEVQTRSHEYTR